VSCCSLLVVALVVGCAGYLRVGVVQAARLSRLFDRADGLALLAVVPTLLWAQNVFSWLIGRF
jgi:hypothetical protein